MADKLDSTLPLRILVDRENRRVIFPEASKDFVDILFSFLSLPMGSIISLLGKKSSQPAQIGCMNNLYESVENLSISNLWTDQCKHMLLHPRNVLAPYCRTVKVNIDNTEPIKYYICSDIDCSRKSGGLLSSYKNATCSCGNLLNRAIVLNDSTDDERGEGHGVFLNGSRMFIISDDLHVTPSSPGTLVTLLSKYSVGKVRDLDEMVLNVELKEASSFSTSSKYGVSKYTKIADLLKHSLISKSPLTEVVLQNPKFYSTATMHEPYLTFLSQYENLTITDDSKISKNASSSKMTLKLLLRKQDNKIMFAEAKDDFVDLHFSFLTIPLGSIVKLLGGISS